MQSITAPPDVSRFARRRTRTMERLGRDALVIPSAPPLQRPGSSALPYRPDSDLYYLTGFTEPECVLVMRGFAEEDRVVLFVRDRDRMTEQWTGRRMGPERAAEALGIEKTESMAELDRRLPALVRGADRIRYRPGGPERVEGLVLDALREARARGARTGRGPRGILDPGGILDELRLRKDADEIRAIREAVRVTMAGVRRAVMRLEPGTGEWEVEAALTGTFRAEGAAGPAFPPIVASGPNACVLHYIENSRRVEEGDLLLIDAGAEMGMYAGDLTRTVPANGRFTAEQRAVWDLVDEARRAAIDRVAPGVAIADMHRTASRVLLDGLIELGLLAGDREELEAAGAQRAYFPHQTSHWLGLDTHDPGDYEIDGESRILEPGMVLTVEPGLYIPPPDFFGPAREDGVEGSDGVQGPSGLGIPDPGSFAGIGVRIEDDVLVTESGHEVLTAGLPVDPIDLEIGGRT